MAGRVNKLNNIEKNTALAVCGFAKSYLTHAFRLMSRKWSCYHIDWASSIHWVCYNVYPWHCCDNVESVSKHLSWLSRHTSSVSCQHTICLEMHQERDNEAGSGECHLIELTAASQPRPALFTIQCHQSLVSNNVSRQCNYNTPSPSSHHFESGSVLFSAINELM